MDRCQRHNKSIPVNQKICSWCASNTSVDEMSKGELTVEVMKLTESMNRIEAQQIIHAELLLKLIGKVATYDDTVRTPH